MANDQEIETIFRIGNEPIFNNCYIWRAIRVQTIQAKAIQHFQFSDESTNYLIRSIGVETM